MISNVWIACSYSMSWVFLHKQAHYSNVPIAFPSDKDFILTCWYQSAPAPVFSRWAGCGHHPTEPSSVPSPVLHALMTSPVSGSALDSSLMSTRWVEISYYLLSYAPSVFSLLFSVGLFLSCLTSFSAHFHPLVLFLGPLIFYSSVPSIHLRCFIIDQIFIKSQIRTWRQIFFLLTLVYYAFCRNWNIIEIKGNSCMALKIKCHL